MYCKCCGKEVEEVNSKQLCNECDTLKNQIKYKQTKKLSLASMIIFGCVQVTTIIGTICLLLVFMFLAEWTNKIAPEYVNPIVITYGIIVMIIGIINLVSIILMYAFGITGFVKSRKFGKEAKSVKIFSLINFIITLVNYPLIIYSIGLISWGFLVCIFGTALGGR